MKQKAIVQEKDGWWIGWLVDAPVVSAQEKARDELIEPLCIGAKDMLKTECEILESAQLKTIEI